MKSERDTVIRSLQELRKRSRLTPDMKETVGSAISCLESYPAGPGSGAAETDNRAFWFNGLDEHDNDQDPTLPQRIDTMQRAFASRIRDIEHDITKHRKKNIKGKDYWYFWDDGKHNSKGPVEGHPDPRDALKKTAEILAAQMVEKEKAMLSCVVKKLGDHAVINVGIFQKFVDLPLPAEAILLKDMLNYPVRSAAASGKPDNGGRSE